MSRPKSDDKRQRILQAATRVFARKGYFGARVSEIARRAGVADGTIYLYFKSKQDLLVALFDEVMAEHLERGRAELAAAHGPAARLLAIAEHHLRLFGDNPDLAVVFQVELRQSTRFLERFTASWLQDYFALISLVIEEGQREGTLRADLPKKLVTKAFFGVLDELVTSWILGRRDYDLARLAPPVVELLLRGVAAPRLARKPRPVLVAVGSRAGGR
jgi:TetR/AcrR family fatty acid metabolism transcriptional regulator